MAEFLKLVPDLSQSNKDYIISMAASDKIKITKDKKRVPVPKKAPKTEPPKKAYNRKKEKDKLRKNQ